MTPRILNKKVEYLSEWVSLNKKIIKIENKIETFLSIKQADYVSILAVTKDGMIPLVKQYRPAVEKFTLELPGGLKEKNLTHYQSAKQELLEETGIILKDKPKLVCKIFPDVGRLSNSGYLYFVKIKRSKINLFTNEKSISCLLLKKKKIIDLILKGKIKHSLHIAMILFAIQKKLI
jgi:ADP-ribose pyrophosphatase